MATPREIEAQVNLERNQIRLGIERLHNNTAKLEEKTYASATVYGVSSISVLLPLLVERIVETKGRIRQGQAGKAFREVREYLEPLEPEAAASIALKVTFDFCFSVKKDKSQIQEVTSAIGAAIENECKLRYYTKAAPNLMKSIKEKYWHKACGTDQKVKLTQTLMNRAEVQEWNSWSRTIKAKLGAWMLDSIISASGWFTRQLVQEGKRTLVFVVPTDEFFKYKDDILKQAEVFAPLTYPMLIEPNDWDNERKGGYLLNEVMKGYDLVRRGNTCRIQGPIPLEFINKIQKVAYQLNPFIVEVAETLFDKKIKVGKFIPVLEMPLPNKPVDIEENYDSRKNYRRLTAEAMNYNAASFKRSCRTRQTMEAVRKFKDVEKFFLPWSFDYRGRAYPIPAFLTPQDTDFGKSLLKFAEGAFMTPEAEEWLAFQVATTYGLDKAPIAERLAWVTDNTPLIERVAVDPIGCLSDWEVADEPWQFLAACEEYYQCVVECSRHFTNLPVATDATCSGLQILAGLARDKSTAKLVNVLPSDVPQDAYKVVAEHAKPRCPESIQPYIDRKVVKRVVMTIPYNAKPYSNRSYIREALKEKGVEISKEDLTATVNAVRDTMNVVVPGPMAVMAWIESEVGKIIKQGAKTLRWVTPSGFVVEQEFFKKNLKTIDLQVMGRCQIRVADGFTDNVDSRHHRNATAPNLIHSLDASLLHLSVLGFDAPIALIHDSVLCRATDMSTLSTVVRETYLHLFAEHDYLNDFADQIGAETAPPIIGDLEPESVIDSTYFFC